VTAFHNSDVGPSSAAGEQTERTADADGELTAGAMHIADPCDIFGDENDYTLRTLILNCTGRTDRSAIWRPRQSSGLKAQRFRLREIAPRRFACQPRLWCGRVR
jgi:hypothetical protein